MGMESQRRFEPEQGLRRVLSAKDRPAALNEWKAAYIAQRLALAKTQAALIQRLYQNPETTADEMLAAFDEAADAHQFSQEQRNIGKAAIELCGERRRIIREVRTAYPDDRELFKAVFGVTPLGPASVEELPLSLNFKCSNGIDLTRVIHFDESRLVLFRELLYEILGRETYGAALHMTPRLPELKGMITVEKEPWWRERRESVADHEEQHMMRHLLLAAEQRASVRLEQHTANEAWKDMFVECRDSIELRLEDELLALPAGGTRRVLQDIAHGPYFNRFIQEEISAFERQFEELALRDKGTDESLSEKRIDLQRVIVALEDDSFREDLWQKVRDASAAYARLRNIGHFSHEEVTALLSLEPLGQWQKLEKRIQGDWKKSDYDVPDE